MDKGNLVEIKKGQEGTGILIEHDGFISPEIGENRALFESYKRMNESTEGGEFHCPYPFVVDAVFQKFGIENANGRIYPESVLKREVDNYMTKIREKRAIGECNHPAESVIDLSRVAINIIELHWEGHTLVGKLEVITSPGFRKHGIISCQGDQIANLILQGIKIGVSSRGLGTVTNKMGVLYVADDYEIVCWDVVSDPSTPNAWISDSYEKLQPFIESTAKDPQKDKLLEKLETFNDWLNE
jgi:hypothetical protein